MSNKNTNNGSSTQRFGWRSFINLISYGAICCIGIALLVGVIAGRNSQIAGAFHTVAELLAYTVTAISAFFFANSRRHWAYYLIWVICVVLIVVLMVI